jgi:hypothetical protein
MGVESPKEDGMTSISLDEKALAWAREKLAELVTEVTEMGVIDSHLVEARPAWVKADEIVIGQLRDQGSPTEFLWIIGGNTPTDCLHSSAAPTARDAARHFSMKWQLEASRLEDPQERGRLGLDPNVDWEAQAKALVVTAEALYAATEEDQLW